LIIATGLGVGVAAIVVLRRRLPRGRFAAFGVVSAGTLFGCAAMSGEVGLLPPTAWFAAVFAAMAGVAIASFIAGRPRPGAI
jgi:membrane associated rhomboid family serine protease